MNGATPAIAVEGLGKSFRLGALVTESSLRARLMELLRGGGGNGEELWALREVSFTIAPGEAVGIIGRNGSGKSTLLAIMSRVYLPSDGSITIRGRLMSLLELGAGFHAELTGNENIQFNGALIGLSDEDIASRYDAIKAFSELDDEILNQPVRMYSNGMMLRLGFSVAVHMDSDVLLVDEGLAVGDEAFQEKCFAKMNEFKKEGKTIMMVTHELDHIERFADRVIWLDRGHIIRDGKPDDILPDYRTAMHAHV